MTLLEKTAPPTPEPPTVVSEAGLRALDRHQLAATSTLWKKTWAFLKTVLGRVPNAFEHAVVASERNDCAFVAKYSRVATVNLASVASLSVDTVTLHTLHAPHPLVGFAKASPLSAAMAREVAELPVVLFVHGMGGQMSQFEPVMGLLLQCLEIYALDLPGFGDSRLTPTQYCLLAPEDQAAIAASVRSMLWLDFSSENIARIIVEFVRQHIPADKKLILVGHSMGTHLLVKVARSLDRARVEGLVLLSPPKFADDIAANPPTTTRKHRPLWLLLFFTQFPFLLDWFRVWDRLEGLASKSVIRQLPRDSSFYMRLRQFRWNLDIDTRVLLRYVNGFSACKYLELIDAVSRFNDNPSDPRAYEKTLLIGGLEDTVTPVSILDDVSAVLLSHWGRKVVQTTMVKNAGHSVLLAKPEFISGIILDHLELKFPERLHLSPAWVLKLKADISGDKWGLKNELKWLKTQSISFNITRKNGSDVAPLLGMKTLREEDQKHSPQQIERIFYEAGGVLEEGVKVEGTLIAIVDISADIPPYSSKSFKHIKYYKCATVSKVAPDQSAVRRFIQLIDDILASTEVVNPLISVHCHYGFNRTGFLICCYLIERLGWSVREAVDGFRAAKSPGIKHRHFIDALYVRYES
ncbi:alpha/beta-hydrolase [Metschnikowia bicuspidata var. bicuspidata NRRL YB-4993]|uniref:Alpha/beta-hydrolase n=1 Tax=Metschnikowia bicuspidata var. bicuspidata NRRL YB-4993 TaxID=869754 RepID=A0A1A0HGJ0_9ASCO|nr:alpha/beta-hydrolase [Metschnikowia bicuspidata var. bicuspidata NRRL YB-4993]OBA23110.1 alpha/beta-hydrolase [Metschnikowia bicuspidata var. bicuspidata NRRL YB-4993]